MFHPHLKRPIPADTWRKNNVKRRRNVVWHHNDVIFALQASWDLEVYIYIYIYTYIYIARNISICLSVPLNKYTTHVLWLFCFILTKIELLIMSTPKCHEINVMTFDAHRRATTRRDRLIDWLVGFQLFLTTQETAWLWALVWTEVCHLFKNLNCFSIITLETAIC